MSEKADLRVNFLRTLDFLCQKGPETSLVLCDGSKQTGQLQAVDKTFDHFGLTNFTTPLGTVKSTLVRTSDVTCASIPANQLMENQGNSDDC